MPTITGGTPAQDAAAQQALQLNAEPESYYQGVFTQYWGADAGNAYATYNSANPQNTAYVNAKTFEARVFAQGLAKAIASVGGVVAGVPGAAAAGAGKAVSTLTNNPVWNAATAVPRFLSMLTSGNLWLRVGEVVAGLILLGIGVNALFKGKPLQVVTKGAALAAKVVPG